MIIQQSKVSLSAQHEQVEQHERRESLTAWSQTADGKRTELRLGNQERAINATLNRSQLEGVSVRLSDAARALQPLRIEVPEQEIPAPSSSDELKMEVLVSLIERLTGKKFELFDARELQQKLADTEQGASDLQATVQSPSQTRWGVSYDYYESHYEAEQTTFSAEVQVKTQDGREINLSVDLSMSRTFMSQNSISIRAGEQLKDPLVINFAGNATELTEDKFSFDIDADGRQEQIAFVGPGSGFLALDRNSDGTINNGSELFGTRSGNGFAELAAFDEDGNQWIDEADAIYSQLRIWSRDAEGNDQLFALGEAGVGAIYLGNVATPFSLKDGENALLGQVRSSGIWLGEEGGGGTLQQVDLVV